MGFFSWTCCKTHLPILNLHSAPRAEQYEVVLLLPDGTRVEGDYDGYGRVQTPKGVIDLKEHWTYDRQTGNFIYRFKLVLKAFYAGETYEQLPDLRDDPGQGHFHDDDAIKRWWANQRAGKGFATYKDYIAAYRQI